MGLNPTHLTPQPPSLQKCVLISWCQLADVNQHILFSDSTWRQILREASGPSQDQSGQWDCSEGHGKSTGAAKVLFSPGYPYRQIWDLGQPSWNYKAKKCRERNWALVIPFKSRSKSCLKAKFVFNVTIHSLYHLNHFGLGFLLLTIKRSLNDTCIIIKLHHKGNKKSQLSEQLMVNLPGLHGNDLRVIIKDIKKKKSLTYFSHLETI